MSFMPDAWTAWRRFDGEWSKAAIAGDTLTHNNTRRAGRTAKLTYAMEDGKEVVRM
eukprot:gene760-21322_t